MSETKIDPSAIVDAQAVLGAGVQIGPRAIIEKGAEIGDRTKIGAGAVIKTGTKMGSDNLVKEYAVLGGDPQHTAYKGAPTGLRIGNGNMIGEFVTMHRAYMENADTTIGDGNYFMAYSHVGHDGVLGNSIVMTNFAATAGHTVIEDRAIMAGYAATHQFVRVGTMVMMGGDAKAGKDLVPYMTYLGTPCRPMSVNLVGLRRNGIPEHNRDLVRQAYRILFHSSLSVPDAVKKISEELEQVPEIRHILEFIEGSKRGIAV